MAVRLRNIVKESGYTERVIMLIVAYKKCLRVLQQEKFITNRAARKMLMEIVHYEQRGAFKLAMALPYLHHAVSTS